MELLENLAGIFHYRICRPGTWLCSLDRMNGQGRVVGHTNGEDGQGVVCNKARATKPRTCQIVLLLILLRKLSRPTPFTKKRSTYQGDPDFGYSPCLAKINVPPGRRLIVVSIITCRSNPIYVGFKSNLQFYLMYEHCMWPVGLCNVWRRLPLWKRQCIVHYL